MRSDENDEEANDGEPVQPEIEIPHAPFIPPPPEVRFERPSLGRGTPGRAFSKPKIDDTTGRPVTVSDSGDSERQGSHLGASLVIGVMFPSCIVVGALIGAWIDKEWPVAYPWGIIVMSLAGIAAGFLNVFRMLTRLEQPTKKN